MKLWLWHFKLECENHALFLNLNTFFYKDGLLVYADSFNIMKLWMKQFFTLKFKNTSDQQNFEKVHFVTNPLVIFVADLLSEDCLLSRLAVKVKKKKAFCNMCCREFWIEIMQCYADVAQIHCSFHNDVWMWDSFCNFSHNENKGSQ